MTGCVVTRDEMPHLQRGAHSGTCPGDACDGCAPVPALPGLLVCGEDADRVRAALREMPELWAALVEATTAAAGASGPDDTPRWLPPAVAARSLIRATLVTWCKVLEDEHGVPLPDERLVPGRTRTAIALAKDERDMALQALRASDDLAERGRLHTRAKAFAAYASGLQAQRDTDADVIEMLREHLDRHLLKFLGPGWVAADSGYDEARVFAEDVLDVWQRARSLAYPNTAAARPLCPCGRRVPLGLDPDRDYRCPGCGEEHTVSGWRAIIAPKSDQPMTLKQLVPWLAEHAGVEVTLQRLYYWRDQHWITATEECCIPRGALGPHHPQCPARGIAASGGPAPRVYDPAAVAAVARERLVHRKAG